MTLPRSVGKPIKEIIAVIKGDIEKCCSNFDYAAPLTEIVLLGTIALRSRKKVEYESETMSFNDRSLNEYIKEPVLSGWEYGESLKV